MKRLLLPFFLAFFVFAEFSVLAQPTLTAANTNVQVGEQFVIRGYDNGMAYTFFNWPQTGPNQVWNFSQTLGNVFRDTIKVLNRLQAPFQTQVSGANVVIFSSRVHVNNNTQFRFVQADSMKLRELAINNGPQQFPAVSEYSNAVDVMRFPFTFNSTYLDTSFYSYTKPDSTKCTEGMFYRIEGQGYGTIITPTTTYNNALLVKTTKESLAGPCTWVYQGFYTLIYYDWYVPGIHFPVVRLIHNGVSMGYYETGYFLEEVILGASSETKNQLTFQTFPNPAASETTIQYDLKTPAAMRLVLTDVLGKEIEISSHQSRAAGSYSEKLDVSHFPKGIYFIRLETEGKVAVKRLVVQ